MYSKEAIDRLNVLGSIYLIIGIIVTDYTWFETLAILVIWDKLAIRDGEYSGLSAEIPLTDTGFLRIEDIVDHSLHVQHDK